MSKPPKLSRQRSHLDRTPVSPYLGPFTVIAFVGLLIATIGLVPPSLNPHFPSTLLDVVWFGLVWGECSIAIWMTIVPPTIRWRRVLMVLPLLVFHAIWLKINSGEPVFRYVLGFGIFMALQIGFMVLGRIPGWILTLADVDQKNVWSNRFSIRSVMLVTLAVATVLAASRRYAAPQGHYAGVLVANIALACIAVLVPRMMLSRFRPWRSIVAIPFCLVGVAFILGALTLVQSKTFPNITQLVQWLIGSDLLLFQIYLLCWSVTLA